MQSSFLRRWGLLVLATLFILGLAACGGGGGGSDASVEPAAAGKWNEMKWNEGEWQ
ncbi:hypothetical protein C8D92_10616 [Tamilnaduibacter salinus]|uniref:Uncharacterized protein n=1 Tax=Tamilnaduibacter salinus TaxID=1484056 RepID=A0A2U1CVI6_9GAMM|nr:hypothetical protein [Tamilnaduibacter salinus]PVY75756.1 hypothetical protein C8D92_10616 [Tamilnaduibacter salinus]